MNTACAAHAADHAKSVFSIAFVLFIFVTKLFESCFFAACFFRTFFSFFIGWFIYFLSSLTLFLIGQINIENAIDNISFHHFMQNIFVNFLIYFSMIGIIYSYYHIQKI